MADSEWASDVMFTSRAALEKVYSPLVRHAVTSFGAAAVLRFFGQPVPSCGRVPHRCRHEVSTNVRERVEGIRLKHWFNKNNLKLYDKGSVLRAECTLRQPEHFKVYRAAEGNPEGPQAWRPVRQGIVDLPARAEVSQQANARYLEALAAVHLSVPLYEVAQPLCRPALEQSQTPPTDPVVPHPPAEPNVPQAATVPATVPAEAARPSARTRRVRALNPLAAEDARLLQAVSRHEFMLQGLRNRDLRALLFGAEAGTASQRRQQSAAVTRKLRLLRAHGLLEKVPHTHRYLVTEPGRKAMTALLAARHLSTEQLVAGAA